MKTCWIVGAVDFSQKRLTPQKGDIVIAADNGLTHLLNKKQEPDYIIGDYDSLKEDEFGYLQDFTRRYPGRVRTLPREKDDTDMMAAVRWGMELGFSYFNLLGALGGDRIDHTISNLQTLLFIHRQGFDGAILGEHQCIFLVADEAVCFPPGDSGMFSLFAADPSILASIEGMKFSGSHLAITYDFPIGCSNEFVQGQEARVEVREGMAFAVMNADRLAGMKREKIPQERS